MVRVLSRRLHRDAHRDQVDQSIALRGPLTPLLGLVSDESYDGGSEEENGRGRYDCKIDHGIVGTVGSLIIFLGFT